MDEAIRFLNNERLKLEREQDDFRILMKKVETEEDYQYHSSTSSSHKLEYASELWYCDKEIFYCLEDLRTREKSIQNDLYDIQEERKIYAKKMRREWADREDEIYQEYSKRVNESNG
jgi:hypothetical protein